MLTVQNEPPWWAAAWTAPDLLPLAAALIFQDFKISRFQDFNLEILKS
jgi:hypothetical protein